MSTSERSSRKFCECPCGQGWITQHEDAPDNAFSRSTFEYSISCHQCQEKYIAGRRELREKEPSERIAEISHQKSGIQLEINQLGRDAIEVILAEQEFGNPKEEYEFLRESGICSEGPIRYKRARVSGVPASRKCKPINNADWIVDKLNDATLKDRLRDLNSLRRNLEIERRDLDSRMEVIPFVDPHEQPLLPSG